MKKNILVFFLFITHLGFSQQLGFREFTKEQLAQIPILTIKDTKKNLPAYHDNSQQIYFRPIFSQIDGSCAQASGIGYTFTYEINRQRNTNASLEVNQFPSHYTYNFLNNGSGANGSNFVDGWQIIKENGCPTVSVYGGMAINSTHWMSGFDKYLSAQSFRVDNFYRINVSTVEGLNTLKNWLYDYGQNNFPGGIANFAAGMSGLDGFQINENGIILSFGINVNHAMTIVGWDDNIGFDFNGDGQITNNIDVNNDNIIDLKDWEKGCLIIANTWGTNWANNGKAYLPYRLLALTNTEGGIGSGNNVFVITVKPFYTPTLLAKLKFYHSSRNKLKIIYGLNKNLQSTTPEIILEPSIVNFQGGAFPTNGLNSQPIEIGYDLTPLLKYVSPQEYFKFFIGFVENDEDDEATGYVKYLSVLNNQIEQIITNDSISLINNDTTFFATIINVNFEPPIFTTPYLPPVNLNQYYNFILSAQNGTPPYDFFVSYSINYNELPFNVPNYTLEKINPTDNDDGYAEVSLDFDFPYFNKNYRKIYILTDGSVIFEKGFDYIRTDNSIRSNKVISVCATDLIATNTNEGIFVYKNNEKAYIYWNMSHFDNIEKKYIFALEINKNGEIKYFYFNTSDIKWCAGVSNGDFENYKYLSTFSQTISNKTYQINIQGLPNGLSLNGNIINGIVTDSVFTNVTLCVKDYNNLCSCKNFEIFTKLNDIEARILLYPNPAKNFITILGYFENYEIIDISGKYILKSNTTYADISLLQPGIYLVKIQTQNEIIVKKLVKN